jgi:hypothetical protein
VYPPSLPNKCVDRRRLTTVLDRGLRVPLFTERIDMPDRLAQNLIMFVRQNDRKLSKRKREKEFSDLTDELRKSPRNRVGYSLAHQRFSSIMDVPVLGLASYRTSYCLVLSCLGRLNECEPAGIG